MSKDKKETKKPAIRKARAITQTPKPVEKTPIKPEKRIPGSNHKTSSY